jgi:hypothetical protein
MEIPNIFSGLASGAAGVVNGASGLVNGAWNGVKNTAAAVGNVALSLPSACRSLAASNASDFRSIISQYDLTRTWPNQFSEMLQRLRGGGYLNNGQFQDLSAIRTALDQAGITPVETVNLLQFYAGQVTTLQASGASSASGSQGGANGPATAAAAQHRLDWLSKVAMLQSSPGSAGLDQTI